jgi:hypothetical protein
VWPLLSAVIPRAASVRVQSGTVMAVCASPTPTVTRLEVLAALTPVDTADALKRNFVVTPCSEGVRFSSPPGPILLLSEKAADGADLYWRFRVTGNDSWSVGIIPESRKDNDDELFRRGKVGLDSKGLSGGVMESHRMHGAWVSVAFDGKAGVATFTVGREAIQQTVALGGPVRLALSTFNGTIVMMSNSSEAESESEDSEDTASDSAEIEKGTRVTLARDYADYDDAESGPLKPGDVGTIVAVDEDDDEKRYRVKADNGKKWWYHKDAIVLAGGAIPSGLVASFLMSSACMPRPISFIFESLSLLCVVFTTRLCSIFWGMHRCT